MISSVLRFAVILLAAAVLTVVARSMFVSRAQQPEAPPPPDVRVRIAAVDLPAGLLLRDGDLDWRAYPAGQVPRDALREGTPQAELNGALVRRKVAAGTVLTAADFMRSDAPGFLAAVLQPGMRAVSVPIDDVSGNAGLIQPGDAVDLILTQRLSQETLGNNRRRNSVVSETVVENARVIAVGSSFQNQSSGDFKPIRARTVTLEVDPKAAEAVTVAAELGSLSLALRSFALDRDEADLSDRDDHASVVAWSQDADKARPVWGEDVSHALRTVSQAPAAVTATPATSTETQAAPRVVAPSAPRRVLVIRGTQSQSITPGSGNGPNTTTAPPSLQDTSEVLQSTLAPDVR